MQNFRGHLQNSYKKRLLSTSHPRISVRLYACMGQPDSYPTDFHKISYVPFLLRLSGCDDLMKITDISREDLPTFAASRRDRPF